MVNSRGLAAVVADALGMPLTSTIQHARNLREAPDAPLIASGGRGRHVPEMTFEDAAALICAVLGSEAIGSSAATVRSLRKLKAQYHGHRNSRRRDGRVGQSRPEFGLDIGPDQNAIGGLAAVLRFFGRESAFLDGLHLIQGKPSLVRVTFEVEYPQHFVSMSVGVRSVVSQNWTFGSRAFAPTEHIRRCRQDALRKIAFCLLPA